MPYDKIPLGGVRLANVANPDEERERILRQQSLQHLAQPQTRQGALSQVGNEVKGQLLGKAASFITKSLFGFQEGGPVMPGAEQIMQRIQTLPPQVQQALEAFLAGQLSLDQLVQVAVQAGATPEQVQQMVPILQQMKSNVAPQQFKGGGMPLAMKGYENGGEVTQLPTNIQQMVQAVAAGQISREQLAQELSNMGISPELISKVLSAVPSPQRPMRPLQAPMQSKEDMFAEKVAQKIRNTGGPRLPQNFEDGGMVEAMMMPLGSPIKSVKQKKKTIKGHDTSEQELAIEFDTKSMEVPMPDSTMKLFGK